MTVAQRTTGATCQAQARDRQGAGGSRPFYGAPLTDSYGLVWANKAYVHEPALSSPLARATGKGRGVSLLRKREMEQARAQPTVAPHPLAPPGGADVPSRPFRPSAGFFFFLFAGLLPSLSCISSSLWQAWDHAPPPPATAPAKPALASLAGPPLAACSTSGGRFGGLVSPRRPMTWPPLQPGRQAGRGGVTVLMSPPPPLPCGVCSGLPPSVLFLAWLPPLGPPLPGRRPSRPGRLVVPLAGRLGTLGPRHTRAHCKTQYRQRHHTCWCRCR